MPKRPCYGGRRKPLIGIQMLLSMISPTLGGMALHLMQLFIAIGMLLKSQSTFLFSSRKFSFHERFSASVNRNFTS